MNQIQRNLRVFPAALAEWNDLRRVHFPFERMVHIFEDWCSFPFGDLVNLVLHY